MAAKRKYPVGVQSFERIRKDGYIYVDKTELVYKMITEGMPYFLSRPRRFGKSLLVSTLEAVFLGRRDLFEAFTTDDGIEQPQLYIATTDWRWDTHPVFRFDFSETSLRNHSTLDEYIDSTLSHYEQQHGISTQLKESGHRLANLIRTAHSQTGRRCVVLVDEYDSQMLHAIGDKQKEIYVRETFSDLFAPLKSLDTHLKFIFITGITKFSQMGIFSRLNQLNNISMKAPYEAICGITEAELSTVFRPDIEALARSRQATYDETLSELKDAYDGYHFSSGMTDIYNPFSLMNAFDAADIGQYWFDSATPTALITILRQMPPIDIASIEDMAYPDTMFNLSFDSYDSPLPVLYQSGYLTIKAFRRIGRQNMYTLGFPNTEVRMGFADCLYQAVNPVKGTDTSRAVFLNAYNDFLCTDSLPPFIEAIRTFFAGVPYQLDNGANECHYHALLFTLLTAFGADVSAEESTAQGRSDIVLRMPKGIYVLEIKYDKPASQAMRQIESKDYAGKYRLDGRPITKVAITFSSKERNITEWKAEHLAKWNE